MKESPLKKETSSICCFGDGKGYVVGSIEGRCGVVNIDFDKIEQDQESDFCFRCHRIEDKNRTPQTTDVYTVNNISFNRQYNTLATAGGDGSYVIWNKDTKARYRSSNKSSTVTAPMTNVCFSEDAQVLAFSIGEDYNLGGVAAQQAANQGNNKPGLYVRKCKQDDVIKRK